MTTLLSSLHAQFPVIMGNVVLGGRESIDDEAAAGIAEFEHCFAASLEDASPGIVPQPLAGYTPSTGPPPTSRRGSAETIKEPLVGRLVVVHMMPTELVLRETVGVAEQTITSIPYAAIRRLTWDHSQSGVKVGHAPEKGSKHEGGGGEVSDADDLFVSLRVENSVELEDELKQREKAEARRVARSGQKSSSTPPASVYLGMFAGFTKPKPFQRKRPNLSFGVPEGQLPSLKVGVFLLLQSKDKRGTRTLLGKWHHRL